MYRVWALGVLLLWLSTSQAATPHLQCLFNTTTGDLCDIGPEPDDIKYSDAFVAYPNTLTLTTSSPFEGATSLRFELLAECERPSTEQCDRVELEWFAGSAAQCADIFTTAGCWYGVAIKIPSDSTGGNPPPDSWRDTTNPNNNTLIMEWTGDDTGDACDSASVGHIGGFNIQVSASEPLSWVFTVSGTVVECHTLASHVIRTTLATVPVTRGSWESITFFIKASTRTGSHGPGTSTLNADGIFHAWINGAQVVNRSDLIIGANNAAANRGFDLSVYDGQFLRQPGQHADDVLVATFDTLRICDKGRTAGCDYLDVAPDGGGGVVTVASAQITDANPERIVVNVNNPG